MNAIPGSVNQVSPIRATSPNWTPPIGRNAPPIGRNRLIFSPNAISCSSTPSQAPASGFDAARWVSRPAPTIASTMNTVPPRRYIPEIVAGSPIRRRIHVARSSNACISMSRNSAAAVNAMMYGSCRFERQAHVEHEHEAHHDDGVERPAVAEHCERPELRRRPQHDPQDEDVVDLLVRVLQPAPGDVEVGGDRAVGGEPERLGGRGAGQCRKAGQDRDQQAGEQCADEVRRPAAPAELRTGEPEHDAEHRAHLQHVGELALAVDPGRVVHRPGERDGHRHDEREREPALLRAADAGRVDRHRASASARSCRGRRT